MLAVFFIACATMVVALLALRLRSETGRSAMPEAAPPPIAAGLIAAPLPAPPAPEPPLGAGAVTTEIRVIQPNYTVAPGDTLASIARRHGTTIEALASINNLENRNSLSVGQRLIIP